MRSQQWDMRERARRPGPESGPSGPTLSAPAGGPDHGLALELVRVTEAAAIAAGRWVGHGDEAAGKAAAAAAMREHILPVPMRGVVVVGEQSAGGRPALSKGADVGDGTGPACDVAVSAGDAALSPARDVPHAITAVAVAERGAMYDPPPAVPMQKLAVGADYADVVDIRLSVAENLRAIAAVKGVGTSDVTAAVLNRPRHRDLVRDIRDAGARVHLVEGGEVAGAVAAAHPERSVDVLLGTGGGEEGVLAAAALSCMGGAVQALLRPEGPDPRDQVRRDTGRVLRTDDLVRGERILFCATGVTGNELLRGVGHYPDFTTTESTVMCSNPGIVRSVRSEHRADG
ncbi:fructose-1,6-bisphosphatase II [Prauserella aidingensis]|uniref:fructose-bisphosphatase class II n=1 Tax=Prauserella aidingensis TaxID=387890 RepID=UPI0020A4DB01|nr:fructose-bisphosphatase class II [Prauserella aidingensis]MCP2256087.1 fructose-1,6-bisphosphatase II [Prauserella aidingensis]